METTKHFTASPASTLIALSFHGSQALANETVFGQAPEPDITYQSTLVWTCKNEEFGNLELYQSGWHYFLKDYFRDISNIHELYSQPIAPGWDPTGFFLAQQLSPINSISE